MSCVGACPECCPPGAADAFFYAYVTKAWNFRDCTLSVGDILREARYEGAPEEILSLIRSIGKIDCTCGQDICWCGTGTETRQERPTNICTCGVAVNPADTDDLDVHAYCHPGM